jgi:hypothetical protein
MARQASLADGQSAVKENGDSMLTLHGRPAKSWLTWNSVRHAAMFGRIVIGTGMVTASVLATTALSASAASGAPSGVLSFPGELLAVTCTSPVDCWAVGDGGPPGTAENQVLHWGGAIWTSQTVPSPAGAGPGDFNQLSSVRCLRSNDCWAVGSSQIGGHAQDTQALHWNGHKWKVFGTPDPGGDASNSFSYLSDVSCISGNNCWAVGNFGLFVSNISNKVQRRLNLLLHWNGTKWSKAKVPNPAGTGMNDGNFLNAIRCTGATNCFAAGDFGPIGDTPHLRNLVLRWNGKKWQTMASVPNPGGTGAGADNEIKSLACTSGTNCWASGAFGRIDPDLNRTRGLDELLHWNGRSWSKAAGVPNPDGVGGTSLNELDAVTCSGASVCWATGEFGSGASPVRNLAIRFNGKKWQKTATPDLAGTGTGDVNDLLGVRCTGSANCFAVGSAFTPGSPTIEVILHWNGKKWEPSLPAPAAVSAGSRSGA